jgi:Phage tail assembly chaperone
MNATDLRTALLVPTAGFRRDTVTIAGNAVIVLEPSAADWSFARDKAREWLGLAMDADQAAVTEAAKGDAGRGLDAAFLVRVLRDQAGDRVFQDTDAEVIRAQWGPEFSRAVTASLELGNLDTATPVADAKNASPETQAASS